MPVTIDGVTLFRISEALDRAGVSRATYFRWVRQGRVYDSRYKDRNGRRLFTSEEVRELERVAHRLIESPTQLALRMSTDRRGLEN